MEPNLTVNMAKDPCNAFNRIEWTLLRSDHSQVATVSYSMFLKLPLPLYSKYGAVKAWYKPNRFSYGYAESCTGLALHA